jgi:hypothetical protein
MREQHGSEKLTPARINEHISAMLTRDYLDGFENSDSCTIQDGEKNAMKTVRCLLNVEAIL